MFSVRNTYMTSIIKWKRWLKWTILYNIKSAFYLLHEPDKQYNKLKLNLTPSLENNEDILAI